MEVISFRPRPYYLWERNLPVVIKQESGRVSESALGVVKNRRVCLFSQEEKSDFPLA
jgi:hypothetical protein